MLRGARRIRVEVKGPADRISVALRRIPGVRRVMREGDFFVVESPAEIDPRAKINETMVKSGWTLLSAESVEMSLEEIFLQLTTKEDEEEPRQ
jgi:ABC-2 type transport system ATP-binding protein